MKAISVFVDPAALPDDIQRLIFTDVIDRAALCSVSARLHDAMIAVSRFNSPAPELYDVDMSRVYYQSGMMVIFKDYHLTCRAGKSIAIYTQEMCMASNHDVARLFIKHGCELGRDVIFSRDPVFRELCGYEKPVRDVGLIIRLIKNQDDDLLHELQDFDWCPHPINITEIQHALYQYGSIAAFNWAMCYAHWLDIVTIAKNVLAIPQRKDQIKIITMLCAAHNWIIHRIVGEMSIDVIVALANNGINKDQLLFAACEHDNLEMFDALVSVGADPTTIGFYDSVGAGVKACLCRITPAIINHTELLKNAIIGDCVEFILENYQIDTDIINECLCWAVTNTGRDMVALDKLISHATNYNVGVYARYGLVILS